MLHFWLMPYTICRRFGESAPNTVLRDAAALHRALVRVDRGEDELIPALGAYERDMIEYGFRAVRTSLKEMERLHSEGILARAFMKIFFRTLDLIPPLKVAFPW